MLPLEIALWAGRFTGSVLSRFSFRRRVAYVNLKAAFGLRYNSDVFWQDYFKKLSEEHSNFSFKLALSKPDLSWQGLNGHITELVNKDFSNASECSAYLCGNKAMIEEATNILLSKGCPKERIYSEKF